LDFESSASTNSTTPAYKILSKTCSTTAFLLKRGGLPASLRRNPGSVRTLYKQGDKFISIPC
ncbi:MAG: hypothetical protein P8X42_13680, partial [Calditrichaceae bacterium]